MGRNGVEIGINQGIDIKIAWLVCRLVRLVIHRAVICADGVAVWEELVWRPL